jgi:hypothetical protein|tara:strand:+ start:312 stop:488 length:177 start_codon:yes stop_codon:yes gene_type:complete
MPEKLGYREALERLSQRIHQQDKESGSSKSYEQVKRETTERVRGFEKRHPNRPANLKE